MGAMMIVGKLIGRVDTRILLGTGLALTSWSFYAMTGWTPDVSQMTIIAVGVIQGIGLGFIFVPLSVVTLSTLSSELRAEGAGLYSLSRNIGSSVGISVVNSLLTRNTQVNHAEIAQHVTSVNRMFEDPMIARFWNPLTAAGRAALDAVVTRQAQIIAYIDDYKLLMIATLAVIPLLIVFKEASGGAAWITRMGWSYDKPDAAQRRSGHVRARRQRKPRLGLGSAPSGEPTLDQLLAEPIVQQLMRRDRTDEATIRHLLQATADARPALRTKDDPDTDDLYSIGRLLQETARLWHLRCDREVRQLPGMTRARCAVLIQLAQHEGVNQAALARILDIRSITLVRLLDRLEAAGLVARMPDPQDRRAHVLALTAKALPIIERIYDQGRKTYDDVQLGISEAEANQLRALLCRVRSNLAAARLNDERPSRLEAAAMRSRQLANCHDRAASGNGGWWNAKLAKVSP